MAIYTMYIKRAHDPLSGTPLDMWAVMDEGDGNRQLAYCSRLQDAERIKALLVYHTACACCGGQGEIGDGGYVACPACANP